MVIEDLQSAQLLNQKPFFTLVGTPWNDNKNSSLKKYKMYT